MTTANQCVLVVDDEPVNREVAAELLAGLGLAVEQAMDGVEALEKARAVAYGLILMDMHMPRLGGLDAVRAIRRLPGYASIPILAFSSNTQADARAQCLEAGMNDFIAKPVAPEAFSSIVMEWLALSGWLQAHG